MPDTPRKRHALAALVFLFPLLLLLRLAELGMLILTNAWMDDWDAGWSAEVDGARAPVLRLLRTFKTIELDRPGAHRVRLVYRPVIAPLACAAMGMGIAGLLLPPLWGRLRRRAASPDAGLPHAA